MSVIWVKRPNQLPPVIEALTRFFRRAPTLLAVVEQTQGTMHWTWQVTDPELNPAQAQAVTLLMLPWRRNAPDQELRAHRMVVAMDSLEPGPIVPGSPRSGSSIPVGLPLGARKLPPSETPSS